jgi:hypothetical protein
MTPQDTRLSPVVTERGRWCQLSRLASFAADVPLSIETRRSVRIVAEAGAGVPLSIELWRSLRPVAEAGTSVPRAVEAWRAARFVAKTRRPVPMTLVEAGAVVVFPVPGKIPRADAV